MQIVSGPSTWTEKFPEARGARQSPVDIVTTQASSGACAPPLLWQYSVNHPRSVVNPGYCWRQWHCHWGAVNGQGSEHTVDGRSFSGELHLVHWNTTKYNSFVEAAGKADGLAVLGVLLMVGNKHDELDKVLKLLPYITHKGDKVTFSDPLDPAKLLPAREAYWTYPGSLTTPPCTESLALMRKLKCGEASSGVEALELLHNCRPPLPLGNRELRDYGGN
ncbi:Erythrocyte carbonic anhydrase [Operophtera brumata]|uniref:Carbonic anhydrase n=1 Tax=Operophtera brumata TaxID=104452 RepID=A0A0L7LW19_OPEBR|nr:Erythrocyte carbonic anhydrase [Operophtera brumata]